MSNSISAFMDPLLYKARRWDKTLPGTTRGGFSQGNDVLFSKLLIAKPAGPIPFKPNGTRSTARRASRVLKRRNSTYVCARRVRTSILQRSRLRRPFSFLIPFAFSLYPVRARTQPISTSWRWRGTLLASPEETFAIRQDDKCRSRTPGISIFPCHLFRLSSIY